MKTKSVNFHSIVIHCSLEEARPEIIQWGEARWWPKNSQMSFVRKTKTPVEKGTRYQQKVLLPFAPSWDVEVVALGEQSITRQFLNGMFRGSETVSIEPFGPDSEIRYIMNYQINGLLNKILWSLVFERMHNKNIEAILSSLKEFLEKVS